MSTSANGASGAIGVSVSDGASVDLSGVEMAADSSRANGAIGVSISDGASVDLSGVEIVADKPIVVNGCVNLDGTRINGSAVVSGEGAMLRGVGALVRTQYNYAFWRDGAMLRDVGALVRPQHSSAFWREEAILRDVRAVIRAQHDDASRRGDDAKSTEPADQKLPRLKTRDRSASPVRSPRVDEESASAAASEHESPRRSPRADEESASASASEHESPRSVADSASASAAGAYEDRKTDPSYPRQYNHRLHAFFDNIKIGGGTLDEIAKYSDEQDVKQARPHVINRDGSRSDEFERRPWVHRKRIMTEPRPAEDVVGYDVHVRVGDEDFCLLYDAQRLNARSLEAMRRRCSVYPVPIRHCVGPLLSQIETDVVGHGVDKVELWLKFEAPLRLNLAAVGFEIWLREMKDACGWSYDVREARADRHLDGSMSTDVCYTVRPIGHGHRTA